ncbi:hypothetical protein TKK_0018073 [Trichogramma kaykai]
MDHRVTRKQSENDPTKKKEVEKFAVGCDKISKAETASGDSKIIEEPSLSDDSELLAFGSSNKLPRTPIKTQTPTGTNSSPLSLNSSADDTGFCDSTAITNRENSIERTALEQIQERAEPTINETPPVQPNPTDNNNIPLQNPNPIIELDEMAEKINYDILLKIVPEFNGYNIPLSIFLKGVNEAFSMVSATQKATLLLLIRSRLTGEAANSIYDMTFTTLDEFKKHFKDYFSSAVEPYQLRARLGTEYQREDERVMTFANRLKELVRRITEAENITAQADVKALEEIAVECFKKGLKESIERKLIDATNIKDIVKNAIAAERSLQARQILRSKDIKQTTHINTVSCQLCNEQNHTADKCPSRLLTCKACKRGGHDLTNCPIMEDETCQLCHKNGHIAKFCKKNEPIKCQICEKTGHSASECNSKNNSKQSEIKCNNCKRIGHKASKCRIDTSKKCNTCNNLGHVDADCFRNKPKNANKNPTPKAENQQSQDFHFKTLKIDVEPNPCFAPLVKYKSFTFLLDTGSQVNLIKNNEFIQNIYDTNKRIEIRGLTSKKITVSGKVKYFISNRWIEFFVVPADTNITHTGIIGTQFFLSNQICLDFSTNAILNSKNIINNKTYGETYEKRKRLCEATDELFYVDILSEQSKHLQGQFLIDTGSEANIVASHLIPQHCKIDYSETFQLKGINNDTVSTIGTIYANFLCEKDVKFLVVPEFCGLPCEGIIGAKFFRQAKAILDFKNKKLITKNVDISFKPRKDVPVGNILMQDNLSANELIDSLISFHNVHAVVSPKIEPIIDEIQESSLTDLKDQESILFPEDDISYAELHLMKNAYDETYEQLDIPLEQNQVFSINSSKLDNRLSKLYDMVDTENLNDLEKTQCLKLLKYNSDCFFLEGDELTATNIVEHKIPTIDDNPVNQKQYRLAFHLKNEVDKQVADLLQKGIIRHSRSSYNSALWVVPKKPGADGKPKWRVVVDFRPLNEKTIAMSFPMPNIAEIFDQIGYSNYFTVIDCVSGFHQIKMSESDAHKTAFSTPNGHFEFVRMPFGLRNAAVEYQRAMNFTLEGLIGKGVLVYMDDIIIYARDLDEHEKLFNNVMRRFRKAKWQLEPSKCNMLRREVKYLGHIMNREGILPDPQKIVAVKNFPTPKKLKNVREFLGLAGFYRRFIQNFGKIAKPMTQLLKKEEDFLWTPDCDTAFNTLKQILCEAPLLTYPDFSKPFIITTDASGYAVGGILSQGETGKEKPIAYTSRVLRGPELNYDTYEKEALAMIHAVDNFRPYVYGHHFTIYTDHQPLIWFKTAELNTRVQKWRFKLAEYQYEVKYKVGKLNTAADALSRNPVEVNIITRAQQKILNEKMKETESTEEKVPSKPIPENPDKEIELPPPAPQPPAYVAQQEQDKSVLNNDTSDESDDESEHEIEISNTGVILAECKDAIESRRNIVVYFSDSNGKPLDTGGQRLLENNKISGDLKISTGDIAVNSKNYFALCIKDTNSISQEILIKHIETCFSSLKNKLTSLKASNFSIAKSKTIEDIEWSEILKIIRKIFHESSIKIIICSGKLIYVPYNERDLIFHECHNSAIGGHKGVSKTFHRIRRNYHWENLKTDIQRRIQQCIECQLKKLTRIKTKQPMCITDTPVTTFDKIALDIVGPLPPTKSGNAYILTMQDLLSKYCIAVPLAETTSAAIADAFIKRFVCTFGCPRIILTDQGRNFISKMMRRVAARLKIKQVRTTAFHPQSNGSLERSHHVLTEYLKIYASSDQQWDSWVELATFNYNTNVQESTKLTPYEIVFGKLARIPSSEPLREADKLPTYGDYIINLVTKLISVRKLAYDNLVESKIKSKKYYDAKLNIVDFCVGDYVFLQKNAKKGKFDDDYTGPHEILEVIGDTNLKIKINDKIQKIVHCNRVKHSHILA